MSCATSIFVIIIIHVTCWIFQITTSGAFHKGYNAGWSYNHYNTKWYPRYGPEYTAILVQPVQDSYSSSSGSSSAEDLSNSASISNPSDIYNIINHKKIYQNNCKCSCKNCDRQKECCKDKCKRCRISTILTKQIPTWPPYYTRPTYMILPYMLPIMYPPSCATTTTSSTSTTSQTTSTTTPTTTTTSTTTTTKTTTTTTPKTTTTTTTTTTPDTTTTTTTPETTTTTTTTPETTTTTTTTTTTSTTTTTTTTSPHTRSTPFVPEDTSASTPSHPILHDTDDASSEFFEEDTTLFLKKDDGSEEDDGEKDYAEEDDGTTVPSHELPANKIITSHTDYLYYDDTTTTAKSSSQDQIYPHYEDYVTTNRPNRRCETPKCLRKKKKTYYYLMKPEATTKSPFLMPTKTLIPRKRFSVVDNAMYNDGTVKGYYNMVDDENMNYAEQYYYDGYSYYADKVYYNEMPVETVNL